MEMASFINLYARSYSPTSKKKKSGIIRDQKISVSATGTHGGEVFASSSLQGRGSDLARTWRHSERAAFFIDCNADRWLMK